MPGPVRTAQTLLYIQAAFWAFAGVIAVVFGQALFAFMTLAVGAVLWRVGYRLAAADRRALILTICIQVVVCAGENALTFWDRATFSPDRVLRVIDLLSPRLWLPLVVIGLLLYAQAWFKPHVE